MNPPEIHIALHPAAARQPASPEYVCGSGTADDPFDGSTAARFDAVLRFLADRGGACRLHLGPGVFPTLGLRHRAGGENAAGDRGWHLPSHWTISGAGAGATTIRLERWPAFRKSAGSAEAAAWAVVGSAPGAAVSGVLVENLTLDGNWPNLRPPAPTPTLPATAAPFVALHCLACLHAGPVVLRRVTATGFYGQWDARHTDPPPPALEPAADLSQEGAAFHLRAAAPEAIARIEHCIAHGGHGDFAAGSGRWFSDVPSP